MHHEKRNPGGLAGASGNAVHHGPLNSSEDSENLRHVQAFRLCRDFGLTWPVARAVAEHAFSYGGTA